MHLQKILLLLTTITIAHGYQKSGFGRFESVNSNRYTEAKSIEENDTKLFLNRNRERTPPAHDTPASSCSCGEFFGE
jgi:hypothetical protein